MLKGKVSVIVPIYNSEKYLDACIGSVLAQSYVDFEIILVNDGSLDCSLKICERYAKTDHRVVVISQENMGVSAARNTGIECATGDYIMFLDSDDELFDDALYKLLRITIEHSADVAGGQRVYIDNEFISRKCAANFDVEMFQGTEGLISSLEFDRRFTGCHGKLFSRKIIDDTRFVEGRKINEDLFFFFQICIKQPMLVYIDVPVYKYYIRKNSASTTSFSEKYFDMIYFCDLKMQHIKEHMPELLERAKNMEVSTHLFFLEALYRTTDKKYRKAEKDSIRIVRQRYFKYHTKNKHERKMAIIVAVGLYPLYKKIVRLKYFDRRNTASKESKI